MFRCIHATVLLTVLVVTGGAKAAPLPEIMVLDTFQYTFVTKVMTDSVLLTITRDGKVNYFYQSAPGTDSGGVNVGKKWEITKKDAAALLDGLVADGLLKMKDKDGKDLDLGFHRVTVSSGRRELAISPKELPEKVLARLLPLLQEAHPAKWKAGLPRR